MRRPARQALVGLLAATLLATGAGTLAVAHDGAGHDGSGDDPWSQGTTKLDRLRFATAPYFDVREAEEDGYGELRDSAGIACIDTGDPEQGAMGIHYVKGDLVGDAEARLKHPEALIYEPQEDGDLELVGVEYVVFKSAWREEHPTGRPKLFGRKFALVKEPNRYGLPPFYELHVWAWRHNPTGTFADNNPAVSCEFAPPAS